MAGGLDHDKLTAFFRELTPAARNRLVQALDGAAGAEIPFRAAILAPLLAARRELGELQEKLSPVELLLAPLAPFVSAEDVKTKTPGIIAPQTRALLPKWLATETSGIVGDLTAALDSAADAPATEEAIHSAQERLVFRLSELLAKADTAKARSRLAGQFGGGDAAADLVDMVTALRGRALLEKIAAETYAPGASVDDMLKAARARLDPLAIKYPEIFALALSLVRRKLPNPQTFVRLAAFAAESTDGARIGETPYSHVLDLTLAEAECEQASAARYATQAERTPFLRAMRGFGAAARALGTEIDLVPDGPHARRLAALRREMAEAVRGDLQDLTPRVRRLVRPRAQERPLEDYEIPRLISDLDLLLIARSYAEEIALNALSGRVFGEVRDLLDTGIPQLMDRFRAADETSKPGLRTRLAHIVDVSAKIFGSEYAALIFKAIEVAGQEARHTQHLRTA